jgi:hypothetical protein
MKRRQVDSGAAAAHGRSHVASLEEPSWLAGGSQIPPDQADIETILAERLNPIVFSSANVSRRPAVLFHLQKIHAIKATPLEQCA